MKKFLSFALTLCLCLCSVVLISCNGKSGKIEEVENQAVDTEEISNEETEEITDAPTEKITEQQETDITINGVVFDSVLKSKLKSAQTYGEICDLLKCEGELVEAPEIIYQWGFLDENNKFYAIWIKFKFTEDGLTVCEDFRETAKQMPSGVSRMEVSEEVASKIVLGKNIKEIIVLLEGYEWRFVIGNYARYRWKFTEDISIEAYLDQSYNGYANSPPIPVTLNDFKVAFVEHWESHKTNTMAEEARLKITAGLTISEIRNIFGGMFAYPLAQGGVYYFCFEDNSRLYCYGFYNVGAEYDEITDLIIFNGTTKIETYAPPA